MGVKNLEQLTLGDLQFLMALERAGGITKAGEAMNLSPSTASRTLKRIREILGDSCFLNVKDGLVATEYFSKIKPVIQDILERMQGLNPEGFSPEKCRRCFRISCMMAEVSRIIGGIVPTFLQQAPFASIHLAHHDNEFEQVLSGNVDFAIVTRVGLPPDIHYLDLYPIERVVLFRKGHPLSQLDRPLKTYDLQMYDRASISTGRHNHWAGPDQSIFPFEKFRERTRLTTTRFNVVWEALEKTDLISICGYRAAEIAVKANDLDFLPLPSEIAEPNIWNSLIWGERAHQDEGCIWLRKIFAEWGKADTKRVQKLVNSQGYRH